MGLTKWKNKRAQSRNDVDNDSTVQRIFPNNKCTLLLQAIEYAITKKSQIDTFNKMENVIIENNN